MFACCVLFADTQSFNDLCVWLCDCVYYEAVALDTAFLHVLSCWTAFIVCCCCSVAYAKLDHTTKKAAMASKHAPLLSADDTKLSGEPITTDAAAAESTPGAK